MHRVAGRIKSGSESAAADCEQLEKEKAELVRQGEELKAQFAALTAPASRRSSSTARMPSRATAPSTPRGAHREFNARLTRLGEERAGFSQRCDNRRFDELDEADIRKGKRVIPAGRHS